MTALRCGRDSIAHRDRAVAEDVGAKRAAMQKCAYGESGVPCQVLARLAESDTAASGRSDLEQPPCLRSSSGSQHSLLLFHGVASFVNMSCKVAMPSPCECAAITRVPSLSRSTVQAAQLQQSFST